MSPFAGHTHILSNLEGYATKGREDDAVALLDVEGEQLSVLSGSAGADCEDGSLWRGTLGGGGGEVEAAGGLFDGLGALDEDAVEERGERLDRLDRERLAGGGGVSLEERARYLRGD